VFLAERLLVTDFFGIGAVSLNRPAMIDHPKIVHVFPDGGSYEGSGFSGTCVRQTNVISPSNGCRGAPNDPSSYTAESEGANAPWDWTFKMESSEKDLSAAEAMDRWEDFQKNLSSEKRRYPIQQFRTFWSAATRYAELTKTDALIHKTLACAVNGLVDLLRVERKRVPAEVLRDAERLECLLFGGYDPYFVGDEPPGL
jgi:hypothetical protein